MSRWTPTHDAVLVLRCREGDAQAISLLVERWHPRLLRHAARLVGETHAAADIVQETWIAAIQRLRSLDDPEAFGSWLFRILTNKSTDWIHGQQRRRRLWDRLLHRTEQKGESHALAVPCADDALQQALAALSHEQAEAVALYYLEDFSMAEVAAIMGVPAGTIKSRLHHARHRLRELLKESDHEQRK